MHYTHSFYQVAMVVCLLLVTGGNVKARQQSDRIAEIRDKIAGMEEKAFRHQINFFFGRYWNSSREELKNARITIKNLKASGKLKKATQLSNSDKYHTIVFRDLQERAYIAREYALPALDYLELVELENLTAYERVFTELSVFRSLSGPVCNRIGYKDKMKTREGLERLKHLMKILIADYEKAETSGNPYEGPDISEFIDTSNKDLDRQHVKMTVFCLAATQVYEDFAKKNKAIRDLEVGSYAIKPGSDALSQMSCPQKRVYVKQLLQKTMM